jgi:hypothetical protein
LLVGLGSQIAGHGDSGLDDEAGVSVGAVDRHFGQMDPNAAGITGRRVRFMSPSSEFLAPGLEAEREDALFYPCSPR